jgi:hypothetical protein
MDQLLMTVEFRSQPAGAKGNMRKNGQEKRQKNINTNKQESDRLIYLIELFKILSI